MTSAVFWSVDDVASYYGISRRLVYHHIQKGALPAVTIGRVVRIRREDALDYGKPVHDAHGVRPLQQHPSR